MVAFEGLGGYGEEPAIRSVRTGRERWLVILWDSGIESQVDLAGQCAVFPALASLRGDDALFHSAAVGEGGHCVRWRKGIEVSGATLWRLALEQGAAWLRAWRKGRGLTQVEGAIALGVSPRMWRYYESGTHLLPKTVRLAALGLDLMPGAA